MNAIAAAKSRLLNVIEGIILTAICQGFPTFTTAVMVLKLSREHRIVGDPGGAAIFVTLASLISALLTCWLGPKFPRFFKASYEPAFFDTTLLFNEDHDLARAAGDLGPAHRNGHRTVAARGRRGGYGVKTRSDRAPAAIAISF